MNGKFNFREFTWIIKLLFSVSFLVFSVYSSYILSNGMYFFETETEDYAVNEMNFNSESEPSHEQTQESTQESAEILTETLQENETAFYFYETPDDVKKLEKEYVAAFAEKEKAGDVAEVFFATSGATDILGNVSIKNATATKKPDFEQLLEKGAELTFSDKSEPLVLIFHTHTTESYLLSDNGVFYNDYKTRSLDSDRNMIRVGKEICKVLEQNGIGYIHDETVYDEYYDGAYSRSREGIEKILKENPTIKIVLDVHRDAIYYSDTSHCKPTSEINGKKAAQIMIITGAQEGYITDFPLWEENLKFALLFQKTAQNMYEGLMKPLYFCQRKYNMDVTPCSLLLEIGTDANTLDEAMYSGYLTGKVLAEIINEYEKK